MRQLASSEVKTAFTRSAVVASNEEPILPTDRLAAKRESLMLL